MLLSDPRKAKLMMGLINKTDKLVFTGSDAGEAIFAQLARHGRNGDLCLLVLQRNAGIEPHRLHLVGANR